MEITTKPATDPLSTYIRTQRRIASVLTNDRYFRWVSGYIELDKTFQAKRARHQDTGRLRAHGLHRVADWHIVYRVPDWLSPGPSAAHVVGVTARTNQKRSEL